VNSAFCKLEIELDILRHRMEGGKRGRKKRRSSCRRMKEGNEKKI
jgi:hypothetical protein